MIPCLSDDQSIERILMVEWQITDGTRVSHIDHQLRDTACVDGFLYEFERPFRQIKSTFRPLDGNLPSACDGEEYRVVRVAEQFSRGGRPASRNPTPPQE
jgi:hypothetical protein